MIKARMINLGARIPAYLKKRVTHYCDRKGVKLQFFITEAISEKLDEIEQEELDKRIADERSKNSHFTPLNELNKYIENRKR